MLKDNGYDGVFCPAMDTVAITNSDAINVLNTFNSKDIIKARDRDRQADVLEP